MFISTLVIVLSFSSTHPTGIDAIAPNLVEADDSAWMTWIEPVNKEKNIIALKCANFEDGEWGDAKLVVQGNNFFANWADFPELGIAKDGTLFATWPQQSGPGVYAYDIAVARSDDAGDTWLCENGGNVGIGTTSPAVKLHIQSADETVARIE